MKMRRKAISIIIVILLVTMIAGFNLSVSFLYNQAKESLDRSLGDRLLSIARAVAPEITADVENDLLLGELSLFTFGRLMDYFEQIRDADDLSGIYLIDSEDKDLLSWDDSLSAIELYLPLHLQSLNQARMGEATVSELYQVDRRYFKSAFYPLGDDSVVVVLMVESAFEFFDNFSSYKDDILIINLVAVAFLLVVGSLIFILNRKLVAAERLLISQAALSQMGQMVAIIAHEVRNPLAIIKATAERIKKKHGGADATDELFDFIPEEIDRLNEITKRYLQFGAPTTTAGELDSVAATVDSVTKGLKREFTAKKVVLSYTITDEASRVLIDSAKLRQILLNLLRNALDATAGSGRVALEVAVSPASGNVSFIVADSGSGLGKKELKRIFDPFYTTKSKGSGLGLFVVRRLVDEMRGTISVTSKVGIGTKFVVNLIGKSNG